MLLSPRSGLSIVALSLGLTVTPVGNLGLAPAQATTTVADPTVKVVEGLVGKLDVAANQQDITAVMQLYGLGFTNSDGLNRQTQEQSIQQFWKQYPKMVYRTQVLAAKTKGKGIEAETLTNITGKQFNLGRQWQVEVFVRSRQTWEGEKLIQQEILSEQTRVSMGEKPPTLTVNLPETVKVGERFNYEAIVEEPLGSDILMGGLLDQPVTTKSYTEPPQMFLDIPTVLELVGARDFMAPPKANPKEVRVKLKRLRSGGFFKSARAPRTPENRWYSAVLMRHDAGVTIVTQRLRVLN
jgi:hypothetical protein